MARSSPRGRRARALGQKVAEARVALRIARISVRGLFNQYDYDVPTADPTQPLSDVAILYGDNGCGKTTLLKLIFHLLSPANNRRHRSTLFDIPFQKLNVYLIDGSMVEAERLHGVSGPIRLTVVRPGRATISGTYEPKKDRAFGSPQFEHDLIQALGEFDLVLYYLSDDRELTSDSLPARQVALRSDYFRQVNLFREDLGTEHILPLTQEASSDDVVQSLKTAHDWIRGQLITAANAGAEDANAIYLQIAKRLSASETTPRISQSESKLSDSLARIKEQVPGFARFGFSPELDVDQLVKSLATAERKNKREVMVAILEPYVSGITARLEKLSEIKTATAKLVDGLTEFFSGGKRVDFTVADGFRFFDTHGSPLQPSWLSSGEQHLVKLFCCTLISRDRPSIFLIDEPELSLNIKWQRVLIDTLSNLAEGSPNQFFFATHSIEILAKHRSKVVELRMPAVAP